MALDKPPEQMSDAELDAAKRTELARFRTRVAPERTDCERLRTQADAAADADPAIVAARSAVAWTAEEKAEADRDPRRKADLTARTEGALADYILARLANSTVAALDSSFYAALARCQKSTAEADLDAVVSEQARRRRVIPARARGIANR